MKVTGRADFDERLATAHQLEERVFLIVEAEVVRVAHETDKDDVLQRVETCKAQRLATLDPSDGQRLLAEARKAAASKNGFDELNLDD